MKCPKCGFNSFEYYDSCKKCFSDLTGFKQTYSIVSMVLPLEAKEKLVSELRSAESAADLISDTEETHNDIFSFNLPDDSSSLSANQNNNPFDFDEPSSDINKSSGLNSEDDAFADLLESTPQPVESPFSEPHMAAVTAPASANSADSTAGPGEFDLENFSWDDTTAATSAPDGTEAADDFDSLFGDTKETPKK